MKQQIAGFLGELAEELGWAPELEQARVRPEMSKPARPQEPAILTPDPGDLRSLATPVDRMRGELEQLRATVKYLGSEVIQLRAQMAHLRRLPAPPDADATDVAAAIAMDSAAEVDAASAVEIPQIKGVSTAKGVEPDSRPWPPPLITKPAEEAVTDQAAGSVDQPPTAPTPPATTKMVVEAGEPDEPEAGLELFASEPAADGDDQPDDKDPLTAGTGDRDDTKGYAKSL